MKLKITYVKIKNTKKRKTWTSEVLSFCKSKIPRFFKTVLPTLAYMQKNGNGNPLAS